MQPRATWIWNGSLLKEFQTLLMERNLKQMPGDHLQVLWPLL